MKLYKGTSQRNKLRRPGNLDKFIPIVEEFEPRAEQYTNLEGVFWAGITVYGSRLNGYESAQDAIEAVIQHSLNEDWSVDYNSELDYAKKESQARIDGLYKHAGPNKTTLPKGVSLREFIEQTYGR